MGTDNLEILRWGRLRNFAQGGHSAGERIPSMRIPLPQMRDSSRPTPHPPMPIPPGRPQTTYDRNVIVKVSYKHFDPKNLSSGTKARIQANTKAAVDYFFRFDNDGFSAKSDKVSKEAAHLKYDGEAVFKVIISPEDKEVLSKEYIRKIMHNLERQSGRKLDWTAIFHSEGEHPHAHIIISRTSSEGCSWERPLKLDRKLISEGIRNYAKELATRILGRKPADEYRRPFFDSIEATGVARIDHVISGNPKRQTNLLVPTGLDYSIIDRTRLSRLPNWQRILVERRLVWLSENTDTGFRRIAGTWRCYNPDSWKDILLGNEKLKRFRHLESAVPISIINSSAPLMQSISGTVIEHLMVDDNSQRVGLVVKDHKTDRLHYLETELGYEDSKGLNGEEVTLTPSRSGSRYSNPQASFPNRDKRRKSP